MNLTLLLPAALAALAALVVPLLVHLARRSEQRPTDFAALRWLRQKPKPRHRIRFDEWPLLLLRLLLLALMALWLARPVLWGSESSTHWIAVVPGVDIAQVQAAVIGKGGRLHWLAPGFPELDQPVSSGALPIGSLLRQLDAELPPKTTLTVWVPEQLDGADAERPRLSRAVHWKIVPGVMPETRAAPRITPVLTVRRAQDHAESARYLRAAASAWQASPSPNYSEGPISEPLPADARTLVWLAQGPLPQIIIDWINAGGTALIDVQAQLEYSAPSSVYWRDGLGAPLVEGAKVGRGKVMRFTRPFTPAAMPQLLEADFPRHLRELIQGPPPAASRVMAPDYAPLTGAAAYAPSPRDLQPYLALLIALVLLLERWLATRRTRGVAP